jgi:hypothetical protein
MMVIKLVCRKRTAPTKRSKQTSMHGDDSRQLSSVLQIVPEHSQLVGTSSSMTACQRKGQARHFLMNTVHCKQLNRRLSDTITVREQPGAVREMRRTSAEQEMTRQPGLGGIAEKCRTANCMGEQRNARPVSRSGSERRLRLPTRRRNESAFCFARASIGERGAGKKAKPSRKPRAEASANRAEMVKNGARCARCAVEWKGRRWNAYPLYRSIVPRQKPESRALVNRSSLVFQGRPRWNAAIRSVSRTDG